MKIEWFETKNGGSAGQIVKSAKVLLASAVAVFVCATLVTLSGCSLKDETRTEYITDSSFSKLSPDVYQASSKLVQIAVFNGNNANQIQKAIQNDSPTKIGSKTGTGEYRFDKVYNQANPQNDLTDHIQSGELKSLFLTKAGLPTDDWTQVDTISNKVSNLYFEFSAGETDFSSVTFNGEFTFTDVILETASEFSFKDFSCIGILNGKRLELTLNDGKFALGNKMFGAGADLFDFKPPVNYEITGSLKVDETLFSFTGKMLAGNKAWFQLVNGSEVVEFTINMS